MSKFEKASPEKKTERLDTFFENIKKDKPSATVIKKLAKPLIALAQKNEPKIVDLTLFSESGLARWIQQGTNEQLIHTRYHGFMIYNNESGAFQTDHVCAVIFQLLKEYEKLLIAKIGELENINADSAAAYAFWKKFLGLRCKKNVIELLQYEPNIAELPENMDKQDELVNCLGVMVSTNGSTRPATTADLNTMSCLVKPEEGDPVEFNKFIEWATCGDKELKEWILTALSVSLFGHPTDRIVNFYGKGGNGKGVLLRLLKAIMGSYATGLPRPVVIKSPGIQSRFDTACLIGKRAAALTDLKPDRGEKLNIDELKKLAGNGDILKAEQKFKESFDFISKAKLFIASNDKIPIDSFGDSEKRRFSLVPFNAKFEEKDETLEERFIPEYGKILNLLIQYADYYFHNLNRKMPECKAIEKATGDFFYSQDIIGQFIADRCTIDKYERMPKKELYEAFVEYCKEEHGIEKSISLIRFTIELEKRGIKESRQKYEGKVSRVFMGIHLKTADNAELNWKNEQNQVL